MASPHPDAETLRGLAQGTLASGEAAGARRHLEQCAECTSRLGEVDPLAGETLAHGPRAPITGEVFLSSPSRALQVGSRVDRYVILERLGAGGMGEIYAAYDPQLDRKVALKLMRADVLSAVGTHSGRSRLLAEAKALARLNHPNVVAVHDVGQVGEEIFIAMELVEGEVLRDWLVASQRSTAQVLEIFKMAGRGLAAAHAVGLVHRDFKPLNVIVGRDGRVRVVDFGLARSASTSEGSAAAESENAEPEGAEVTQGMLSGTPAYMSPEQLCQEPTDARTDQFSFAVSLYEALCGHRPFTGATPVELFQSALSGLGPPPPKSAMPPWLHAVLARALSANRELRYPSMDALLEALEKDPSLRRRRRWRMAGVALAAVAVVSGAAVARFQAQEQCAPPDSRWEGVWDSAREARLRGAFARSDKPFARAAADAVDRALDRYRAEWLSMGQAACLATLDGAQPREVLGLRTACLDQRLADARALVEQLSRGDEAAVKNAARAVENLQPLSDCADEQALRAGAAWPLDPSHRGEVEAIRAKVREARSLVAVGSFEASLEASAAAARGAAAIGYKPLVAEAELLLAQAYSSRMDLAEAIAAEHRAAAAAQATGQLELVMRAWTMLVRHSAKAGGEWRVWAAYAEALLGRLPGDTRGLRMGLLRALAAAEVQARQYARALALARESLALAEATNGPEHPTVSEALGTIATCSWYLGDLDTAVDAHQRASQMQLREKGPDHPIYAAHLGDLAGILIERGDWEEGLRRADQADAIYRRVMPPDSPYLLTTAQYRAIALAHLEVAQGKSLGAEAGAREVYQALRKARGENDEWALSLLTTLATVYRIQGRCAEAVPIFQRSEAFNAPRAVTAEDLWDVAETRQHLGACFLATGAPDRARITLEQAVKWFEENGTRNFLRAEGQFLLAQARWQTGQKEAARKDAEAARALLGELGPRGEALLPEVARWLASR